MVKMERAYIQIGYKNVLAISQPILDCFLWFRDRKLNNYVHE